MPSVYEYATSEASNSTTGGWNTAEGMDPSAVNDGMRVHKQNVSGYLKDQGGVNTVGGTGNAITVTLAAAPVALVDGYRFTFNASAANTGNTTITVTPAGGSAFTAKKLLKWEAGSAIEIPANSIPAANALTEVIYDSARDSGNGAFMLLGSSVAAATTSAAGIVELATDAETITGTDTARAITPANLAATRGKQSVWVPAGAMTARTTNGAASGTAEMATNRNMVRTLDYDSTTQEFAQFDVRMPKSWDEGTVTFIPVWSHAATTVNFGVVWSLDAVAISDNETLDVAFGTEQTSTDTGGTTNRLYQGPESAAITIAGTPAEGDYVQFRVKRVPANASDTMAIDARLHGILLLITINAANDS